MLAALAAVLLARLPLGARDSSVPMPRLDAAEQHSHIVAFETPPNRAWWHRWWHPEPRGTGGGIRGGSGIGNGSSSGGSSVGSIGGRNAAYVFGLAGSCADRHRLSLLTGIHLLLETGPTFPVVVMLIGVAAQLDTWLIVQLHSLGVVTLNVTEVRDIKCSNPNDRTAYFAPTYSLLAAWSLAQFDVLLYLDSDLAVIQNLDHVLWRMLRAPHLRELRTPVGCEARGAAHRMWFNTGVWAFRPDALLFAQLQDFLRSGAYKCGVGFQEAAYTFFSQGSKEASAHATPRHAVEALHVGYNLKADCGVEKCMRQRSLRLPDAFVVHWSGLRKPEKLPRASDSLEQKHLTRWQAAHQHWTGRLARDGGACANATRGSRRPERWQQRRRGVSQRVRQGVRQYETGGSQAGR